MNTETEQLTIAIVDKQLDAYNARDIDAFAATYHENVEIHSFSKGLQYTGRDTLIERYGKKFASLTYLNATSLKRIVLDRFWLIMNWQNRRAWRLKKLKIA